VRCLYTSSKKVKTFPRKIKKFCPLNGQERLLVSSKRQLAHWRKVVAKKKAASAIPDRGRKVPSGSAFEARDFVGYSKEHSPSKGVGGSAKASAGTTNPKNKHPENVPSGGARASSKKSKAGITRSNPSMGTRDCNE
jgi:hypothetical protein